MANSSEERRAALAAAMTFEALPFAEKLQQRGYVEGYEHIRDDGQVDPELSDLIEVPEGYKVVIASRRRGEDGKTDVLYLVYDPNRAEVQQVEGRMSEVYPLYEPDGWKPIDQDLHVEEGKGLVCTTTICRII